MSDENGAAGDGVVADLRPEPPAATRPGPFDLNAQQKVLLVVILIAHVFITRLTLRDLRDRPASAVRGPKRLWRLWAVANTTGSLGYWVVGRRRGPAA